MSGTMTQDQYESVKLLEGEKSTILTTAIIKLFIFHQKDQKWVYSGLAGGLCLVIDRSLKGAILFRLYDLNFFDILFEQELYYAFLDLYQELNEQFYCFPVIGNFVFGFSFADINEAINFKIKIGQYCPKKSQQNEIMNSSKISKITNNKNVSPTLNEIEILKTKFEKPINFKHLNHVGWNPIRKCFDFSLLSKEYKTIFKNAGIKKKEMKDSQTALAIYEALLNQNNLNFQSKPAKKKKNKKNEEKSMPSKKSVFQPSKSKVFKNEPIIGIIQEEDKKEINNIPQAPNLNLNLGSGLPPPPVPSINLQIPAKTTETIRKKTVIKAKGPQNEAENRSNLIDQIKSGNFKLKKVEKSLEPPSKVLSKQEEMSLTSTLAKAIGERRKQMVRDEESSESESDWSDD